MKEIADKLCSYKKLMVVIYALLVSERSEQDTYCYNYQRKLC